MRIRVMLVLLAALSSPCFAAKLVTVPQLEQVLSADSGKPDAEIARQLSEIELSERLGADKLSRLQEQAPGLKSRQALLVLADLSAFLALPAAEIPARTTPDLATQRQIMALAVDYVLKAIHQLPNLSAMRVTTSFQSTPWQPEKGRTEASSQEPLHVVGIYNASIFYRDGGEVLHTAAVQSGLAAQGLTTAGEFGPILNTALLDAAHSKLAWSHWEQGAQGVQAVFHYTVPAEKSHYEVKYCCIWRQNGDRVYFQQFSGYQGDIAVDPSNGTILRLTLMAELKPTDPLVKAGILVEYGPVVIAGKTYICPTRSVALSVGLELRDLQQGSVNSLGLLQTSLNDLVFEQYHVFRAESRVLAANRGGPDTSAPAPDAPATAVADPAPAASVLAAASGEHLPAAPRESKTANAPSSPVLPPEPAPAEISVEEAVAAPPEPSPGPLTARRQQTTLRATTRLVDVGVLVLDKKGGPVAGLKAEDFEVYDNGRKQVAQLLHDGAEPHTKEAGSPAELRSFSNSRSSARGSLTETINSQLTVLLIDPANLSWVDLTYLREEILRALPTLPADERVALYVTRGQAFQVLEEGTSDRAQLASKLRSLMPDAQDLARAQQAEEHDRQNFNDPGSRSETQYLNGNTDSPAGTTSLADSTQRDSAHAFTRESQALYSLIHLARSLAATPGQTNLLWLTSENLLADWGHKAVGDNKGSNRADGLLLKTEQALNYARIRLYAVDASRNEKRTISASLHNESGVDRTSAQDGRSGRRSSEPFGGVSTDTQQDPAGGAMQQLAEATGGQAVRPGANLAAQLQAMIADSRAMYTLSFTPDLPPDDQYHRLTIKLPSRRGVSLEYRSGYQYSAPPATLKERFQEALWQPADVDELGLSATPVSSAAGSKLLLKIATADVALKLQEERWKDKLDIFLVKHDEQGVHATITGQTLSLALKAATFDELTQKGIPFEQLVGSRTPGSVRVLVVDENSGLMGSVTVPANALAAGP